MALIPKLTVLAQELDTYGSVTLQDTTGAYNPSTNPGGYGAPNPGTGDVQKILALVEYMGTSQTPTPIDIPDIANYLGAGVVFLQNFLEGVTRITALVGFTVANPVTALEGNYEFDLSGAATILEGCSHISLNGDLYQLDYSKTFTGSKGYVLTPFTKDYTAPTALRFFAAAAYTLWKQKGYEELIRQIGELACSSIECTSKETDLLMAQYRMYLSIQPYFDQQDYIKAHNLAVALAPDQVVNTPCQVC
jgi:hypothetical protein